MDNLLRLLSFDVFRSLGIPNTHFIKPEEVFKRSLEIEQSDWILFPPHSLMNLVAYAFGKKIFPSVNTYHLGFDKIQMTRAFMIRFPKQTPQTQICSSTENNIERILDNMTFPFVVKEVRNACGRGVFLVKNRNEFLKYANTNEILYIQEYLEINRDLRVVWVGNQVVLAYWRIAPSGGFLNNISAGGEIDYNNIPTEALDLVSQICTILNINYAGFDIAILNGHCYLLEYNLFFGTQALNDRKINLSPIIHQYLLDQSANNIPPQNPKIPKAA